MAATARLWPFYFLWLRIDSILKFVEPVTNTDEESLSVVLLQQGLHCIFSPSYRRFHGRGRHLGSGANAAKFSECMGKIVILMLDNSRKFDILQFL